MTLPARLDLTRRPFCRAREAIEDDWELPLFLDDPEIRNEKRARNL